MDADKLPKGISQEVSEKFNQPGVYRHPVTGAEVTCYPGKRAVAQADAFVRLGFQRVGEQPSLQEIRAKDDAQLAKEKAGLTSNEAEPAEDVAELKKQLKLARAAQTRAENKLKNADDTQPDTEEPKGEAEAEPTNEKENE